MALLSRIIHCLADPEPTLFHQTAPGMTCFAVNLSFERTSDGIPAEQGADEDAAQQEYLTFLHSVPAVEFHLYRITDADPYNLRLTYHAPATALSETAPLGNPNDLHAWLASYVPASGSAPQTPRYWSTVDSGWRPDRPVDTEAATATHRLRAAQSWNAPVGHKFGLTHILQIKSDHLTGDRLVVLPHFKAPDESVEVHGKALDPKQGITEDAAFDFTYDALGGIGPAICRTNIIGAGVITELDPALIDEGLTSEGYFKVDEDAATLRRLIKWFEARAASLLAAAPALAGVVNADDAIHRRLFELPLSTIGDKPHLASPASAWLVTASLLTALDSTIIAFLKPIHVPGATDPVAAVPDGGTEGEILAPFVSAVLASLEQRSEDSSIADESVRAALHELADDVGRLAMAIRDAVRLNSPLMTDKGTAATAQALLDIIWPEPALTEEDRLVQALLLSYGSGTSIEISDQLKAFITSIKGQELRVLKGALSALEQSLQEEAGSERAIIRIIESAARTAKSSLSGLIAEAAIGQTDAVLRMHVAAAIEEAWLAYRTLLDGPFNGAEAVRLAAGNSFCRAVLTHERLVDKAASGERPEKLCDIIIGCSYYSARLFGNTDEAKCFDPLIKALITPVNGLGQAGTDLIRQVLDSACRDALGQISTLLETRTRFIPDSAPQPLAIQIAASIDGSDVDRFAKYFNGIGTAIRRRDHGAGADEWAYAHLADLSWTPREPLPPGATSGANAAIHPMLPALADGRGAMFLEYEGFPFADPAFDERIVDSGNETRAPQRPLYEHDPHAFGDGFAKTPRLAYGRSFETFSFVTSNAGTLPLGLQGSYRPWMPGKDIKDPSAPIGKFDCQRRTAITEMTFEERTPAGAARRIGASHEGVYPLATDYPRLGLMAEKSSPGTRDVFRESDGTGMMVIPDASPFDGKMEWRISDIQWQEKPTKLVMRFFHRHAEGPDDKGAAEHIFDLTAIDLSALKEIVIGVRWTRFSPPPPGKPGWIRHLYITAGKTEETLLPADQGMRGWVRIEIETDGAPAAMTFPDSGSRKTDGIRAPLLLLAEDEKTKEKGKETKVWNDDVRTSVATDISTPRVGYLDFERWFANSDLYRAAFLRGNPGDDDAASFFWEALLIAYVMRHLDPQLASHLDKLPDPAVEAIRVELTVLTCLRAKPEVLPSRILEFKDAFYSVVNALHGVVKELRKTLEKPDDRRQATPWTPALLIAKVFKPLDAAFKFTATLAAGPLKLDKSNGDRSIYAAVPKGHMASLVVETLVPYPYFEAASLHPSVFHPGLLQYAPRRRAATRAAFPATEILIEVLLDAMGELASNDNQSAIALAGTMIAPQPVGQARRFDVMTLPERALDLDEKHHDLWRLLGEIDVTTQRWRSTGRPIYHHVNPRKFRQDGLSSDAAVDHAALPLSLDKEDELAQFELEAFFDRPNIDAHSITQRLNPLPARTKLQEHHWNSSSATYFRHRLTLRSRYAGALRDPGRREVTAWLPKTARRTPAHGWTMRVAMLAELSRDELTRPQLRALIPLTTAPDGDDAARPAPPVIALLQEPPFARAGLADRIASEVKTGFGYGFTVKDKPVEIIDARKEAGPTPFLSYRPLPADNALSMALMSEGPIGLTFDNIEAPGAAFPNSMLSLKPHVLLGEEPPREELMMGISMRRYVDADWTYAKHQPAQSLDAELCWWIENLTQDPSGGKAALRYNMGSASEFDLLTIQQPGQVDKSKSDTLEVWVPKLAIDGVGGAKEKEVCILRVNRAGFGSLTVLHQPVAPGRYSTSIFLRPRTADTARGHINLPVMMANFEWSPPKADGQTKEPAVFLNANRGANAHPTMASAPTALNWAHTSRDFDFVHVAPSGKEPWTDRVERAGNLDAKLSSDHTKLTFTRGGTDQGVWVCPSTFLNPYPVHLHRHLAVITSRFVKELGRPLEIFCRTSFAGAKDFALTTLDGVTTPIYRPPEHCVRIVELETPAAILTRDDSPVPDKYKTAYFDLVSTGFKPAPDSGCLRLHFRFVGPAEHIRKFNIIKLFLWQKTKPDKPVEIKLNHTKDAFTTGIYLTLGRAGSPATEIDVKLLRSTGELTNHPVPAAQKPHITIENANPVTSAGLFVSLQVPDGGEFWCDVSLLHSSNTYAASPLDFSWLFSPSDGGDPAGKVSARGLNEMVEAQARIISVSPPISIISH